MVSKRLSSKRHSRRHLGLLPMVLLVVVTILWRTRETIQRIQVHTQEREELVILAGTTKTSSSTSSSVNATIRTIQDDGNNNNDTNELSQQIMVFEEDEEETVPKAQSRDDSTPSELKTTTTPKRRFIRRPSYILSKPTRTIRPTRTIKSSSSSSTITAATSVTVTTRTMTAKTKPRWKDKMALGIRERKGKIRQAAYVKEPIPSHRRSPEQIQRQSPLFLSRIHFIYRIGTWDGAPIVIPQYKLLFFTTPKVGCTVFKQLFRRMAGYKDWRSVGGAVTHNPNMNGLKYLYHFSRKDAIYMLTSKEWTRAIFVRNPKDRILSAYLDKAAVRNTNTTTVNIINKRGNPNAMTSATVAAPYVVIHCCPKSFLCGRIAQRSFADFLQVAHSCSDPHWASQSQRMEGRYWPYIDFIGHIENAAEDAKTLLTRIGAWDMYGASGWGTTGTEPIFASTGTIRHGTGATNQMENYYTPETEAMVEDMYADDFQNPLFGFGNSTITNRTSATSTTTTNDSNDEHKVQPSHGLFRRWYNRVNDKLGL